MKENNMVPSNWQINFQLIKNVLRRIVGQGKEDKIQYHKWDSNPDWDCQPWTESYENHDTLATHAYHTEVYTHYTINSKLVPIALWSEHPNVFRHPKR